MSTPAVRTHGAAVAFSKPGLPRSCWAADEAIVRLTAVVWVSVPEVPVIVTVAAPTVAVALAVKVTTLVEVAGFVPKVAVTPAGRPEAESVTLPVNPLTGETVTVLLPLVPCVTVRLAGEADSVKSGVAGATTFRLMAVV